MLWAYYYARPAMNLAAEELFVVSNTLGARPQFSTCIHQMFSSV